jgi:hypothetical protein
MFGDLWNQAKDKQLLEQEKRKEKKLLQNEEKRKQQLFDQEKRIRDEKFRKQKIFDREQSRKEYSERLDKYRRKHPNTNKEVNTIKQNLLKRKLNQNILNEIELAKQKGITNILKCPKFIKFIKKSKVNNIYNIYIEWELINLTNVLDKNVIGINFDYNKSSDTPLELTNELQKDLIELKYWIGNDCKEYLNGYLELNI